MSTPLESANSGSPGNKPGSDGKKKKEFAKWQRFIVDKFWLLSLISCLIVVVISAVIMIITKAVDKNSLKVPSSWKPSIEKAVASVQKNFWAAQNSQKQQDYNPQQEYGYLLHAQITIDMLRALLGKRVKELKISVDQYETNIKARFDSLQDHLPRNFVAMMEVARNEFKRQFQTPEVKPTNKKKIAV